MVTHGDGGIILKGGELGNGESIRMYSMKYKQIIFNYFLLAYLIQIKQY